MNNPEGEEVAEVVVPEEIVPEIESSDEVAA